MMPGIERLIGGQPLPRHLRGASVALGNFDGFHLGHQAVAAKAVEVAQARGVGAIVATFDPHPVGFFRPQTPSFRLAKLEQLQHFLGLAGVDAMMVFQFDSALASATPEEFVRLWLRDVGDVVTGADFSFGKGRAGDTELLRELGTRQAMTTHIIPSVEMDGDIVSSSRIRAAIREGDCTKAARLMTRPFTIAGKLGPGRRMDPALAMLDATIDLDDYLRPRRGVYAVRARIDNDCVFGGSAYLAPVLDDERSVLELFLVNLADHHIGAPVLVELIAHLHDATDVFEPEALRRQITQDRSEAHEIIAIASGLFDQ
jgi:riboflavin kinase / FMN adenylyltransferase